ncbi:hypothetical protein C8R43DRAFT_964002 [Mycena crocata]|nr:hypothetical protein C8R43DRAFT_964002 [Mycena crocata]
MAKSKKARKASRDNTDDVTARKRREASKRYYERHPEVREKNRRAMKQRRMAKKEYRRQWDPPKGQAQATPQASSVEDDDWTDQPSYYMIPADKLKLDCSVFTKTTDDEEEEEKGQEAVAKTVLTQMYHRAETMPKDLKKPMSLAEIDAYQSSESEVSDEREGTPCPPSREPVPRKALMLDFAERREQAILDGERAARMRIHVQTSLPAEKIHEYRGTTAVSRWLSDLSGEEST